MRYVLPLAAALAIWSGSAQAQDPRVESKCVSSLGGLLLNSLQYLPGPNAPRQVRRIDGRLISAPCQPPFSEVRTPIVSIRPSPQAVRTGLVPPGAPTGVQTRLFTDDSGH
jgi:hypothetical protein